MNWFYNWLDYNQAPNKVVRCSAFEPDSARGCFNEALGYQVLGHWQQLVVTALCVVLLALYLGFKLARSNEQRRELDRARWHVQGILEGANSVISQFK